MSAKPLRPSDVQLSKMSFSDLKPYGKGKRAFVNYMVMVDGEPRRESLVIQTPDMAIPFDTGSYYENGNGGGKWAVKVSF